jgi:hypothetical protein
MLVTSGLPTPAQPVQSTQSPLPSEIFNAIKSFLTQLVNAARAINTYCDDRASALRIWMTDTFEVMVVFIRKFAKRIVHMLPRLWLLKWHILATIIFALVISFTLTANIIAGPLPTLTPPTGTLLLSLLSKGTDYAFSLAVDASWEMVQWGPMINGGERLLTYFLMTCGFESWLKTLFSTKANKSIGGTVRGSVSRYWPSWPRFLSFIRSVLGSFFDQF